MQKRISDLSRRELLKLFGISVGSVMANAALPRKVRAQSKKITPRKNVRNVLVVQNCGAMSPMETLDLKQTRWTADDLDIQKVNSDFSISKLLFPNYQKWAPRASLVRSTYENSLVHFSAQYHTQAGRALNSAILREIPALGSVVAMELEPERRESDTFPTFISFDLWNVRCPQIGAGMLPPRFAGLDLNTTSVFDSFSETAEDGSVPSMPERWEGLSRLMEVSPTGNSPIGGKADDFAAHYGFAYKILTDPRFKKILALTEEEKIRYGVPQDKAGCKIGLAMLLARNLLAADTGTRFLWVSNAGNGGNGVFDNHVNLYGRGSNMPRGEVMSIYDSAPRFDRAFSSLVEDLSTMPGRAPGKTLLDETMVLMLHEFGRTPEMNPARGRDHAGKAFTNLFLGGGVKPGRIIGKTDELGEKIIDIGWKYKEQPMMDHVTSTIYSALGIDYSKTIVDTPSGRAYEYQQTAPLGGPAFIPRAEIEELFV
jgi:hypothetical protein